MAAPNDSEYDKYDFPTNNEGGIAGSFGNTTSEQDDAVGKVRSRLIAKGCGYGLDTLTLLRFLRKKEFDVDAAEKAITDANEWRENYKVDEMFDRFEFPEQEKVLELYPQFVHKTDKVGRPVYYARPGVVNTSELFKVTTEDNLVRFLVNMYENLERNMFPECSRKAGHLVEQFVMVFDLAGLSMYSPSMYSLTSKTAPLTNEYYPKRVYCLYFINAPWAFTTIFSYIKQIVGEQSLGEYHVLSTDYSAKLLEQIDEANLPAMFGGACECEGGCEHAERKKVVLDSEGRGSQGADAASDDVD